MIKSRLRMGMVPGIQLHLFDENTKACMDGLPINESAQFDATDVVNGKLDAYLERQIKMLDEIDYPIVLFFINKFNLYAYKLFGASGKDKYFSVEEKEGKEALYNKYGDKSIPDGPERVRDAWKRLRGIMDKTGASSHISLASHTGAGHQNTAFSYPNVDFKYFSHLQSWNKLQNYWPGDDIIDFIGMSAYWLVLSKNKNERSLFGSAYYWNREIQNSGWKNTPLFFAELAPKAEPDFAELKRRNYMPDYIRYNLKDVIPNNYPVSFVLFITPPFSMDRNEAIRAFTDAVINNDFYADSVNLRGAEKILAK